MRSRYTFVESQGVYFVTSTIVEWIPVFIGADYCNIMTDSLAFCRANKGLRLYAYVIMDNHLHLVLEAPDLSGVVQSFKRHTAREIIRTAESNGKTWLLNQFQHYKQGHKHESQHQVWQEGVHPQLIQSDTMLRQKIEYIHNNPVRRGYVESPEHWRYSSAGNYAGLPDRSLEIDPLPL